MAKSNKIVYMGTGRRKSSIARVRLVEGTGKITINKKDIEEIPEIYLKGLTFHYVENVKDVLEFALLDEKVDNPVNYTIDDEEKENQTKQAYKYNRHKK